MKHLKNSLVIMLLTCCMVGFSQNKKLHIEPYVFKSNTGEKINAELGKFPVPENRKDATSRNINLHFVRFKSTNPNPENPIVYLAGGPGGSGISTAKGNRFQLFMEMRKIADVIAFDQRGTGLSNQIPSCKVQAKFPLDVPGDAKNYISKMSEASKKCISFWKKKGVAIEGYNTVENANDLEALRIALGAPKINLWGISYGSHLAFDFIKRYENSVDKVVLAGLEGLNQTIKLPKYNQNFLKYLNTKIQLDKSAAIEYPDLLKLMEKVLDDLEKTPQHVEVINPSSRKKIKVGISKLDVQLVTSFFLTKNPENSIKLPYLFKKMSQGDFSEIAQMVVLLKTYAGRVQAMPLIMDAMSGVSKKRLKKIRRQSKHSLLGSTTNFPYPEISNKLDVTDLGNSFRKNPTSSVPALFFSGTLDGRTYIESAKKIVTGFRNSSHIIIDGAGHDMFMSTPKVKDLMLDFFRGNKIPSKSIEIKVPKFILSK
tara:strand:- start:11847 stop:13298 length:1452 start_codon:yes stop_codon:yes gene_type:complete